MPLVAAFYPDLAGNVVLLKKLIAQVLSCSRTLEHLQWHWSLQIFPPGFPAGVERYTLGEEKQRKI